MLRWTAQTAWNRQQIVVEIVGQQTNLSPLIGATMFVCVSSEHGARIAPQPHQRNGRFLPPSPMLVSSCQFVFTERPAPKNWQIVSAR